MIRIRPSRALALVGIALVWLGIAAAGHAGASDPIPTPEPPDPTPQICISRTTLSKFTSSTKVGRDPKVIRAWATENGIAVPARGRIPGDVERQYNEANGRS